DEVERRIAERDVGVLAGRRGSESEVEQPLARAQLERLVALEPEAVVGAHVAPFAAHARAPVVVRHASLERAALARCEREDDLRLLPAKLDGAGRGREADLDTRRRVGR